MTDVIFDAPTDEALQQLQDKQEKLEQKQRQHEEKMDKALLHMQRPSAMAGQIETPEMKYAAAFTQYLRKGDFSGLVTNEVKALSGATNSDGGFLFAPQVATQIDHLLRDLSPMRSVARVMHSNMPSVEFIIDKDDFGAIWADESTARTESTTTSLDKVVIKVYEMSAMPKVSQRLLDDVAFDIEAWLADRMADKFARAENNAFVLGDGVNKPVGFLNKTQVAQSAWAWGKLGYVATGNAAGLAVTNPYDNLIDLVYSLKSVYRHNAVFLMNSRTAAALRKVKDTTGNYIWCDSMAADQLPKLLGYSVQTVEDMPDIGANTVPVAFGNFQRGYTVIDGRDLRTMRDPYTAKPHVMFYSTKRTGGDVTDFDAIKLLKCTLV